MSAVAACPPPASEYREPLAYAFASRPVPAMPDRPPAKRKRAKTPPDVIVISDSDSDGDDARPPHRAPPAQRGPHPADAGLAAQREAASLAAARHAGPVAAGYRPQAMPRTDSSHGHPRVADAQPASHGTHAAQHGSFLPSRVDSGTSTLVNSSRVSGYGYGSSSKSYATQADAASDRRSDSAGMHPSKRQKKQTPPKAYSVESDDGAEVAPKGTGPQSTAASSTVYTPNNNSSSVRSRAPSCDDKEGHYKIVTNQLFGPRDRYKIISLIGQGTFGKVVKAWDREAHTFRAIKIIRAVQKYREASFVEIRVLKKLKERDPGNERRCIHLLDHFDHRNHVCMVFDLLDKSIFDFLKENDFNPFPYRQIKDFAYQLLRAVAFLHDELHLVHTDLKPENLMLVNASASHNHLSKRTPHKGQQELRSTEMRLIDFGSATFDSDYHSSIVSTRHYRAPEIILGMRWSYPCDVWSVGCILVEFLTGDALFQTHDNLEHLAMMQIILGDFPKEFLRNVGPQGAKYFRKDGKVDFPNAETPKSSIKFVKGLKPLAEILQPSDRQSLEFLNLVKSLVHYDPSRRITAASALKHPFFID